MSQLNLPLANPRDRGRLNALRNILASVSDELRQNAAMMEGLVYFVTQELPDLLRASTPFDLLSADATYPVSISPYAFTISDLVDASNRPSVFNTAADLVSIRKLVGGGQNDGTC